MFHQRLSGGVELWEVMVSGGGSRPGSLRSLVRWSFLERGVEAEGLFLLVVACEVNARGRR